MDAEKLGEKHAVDIEDLVKTLSAESMPPQELADLVKHAVSKIDLAFHDGQALCQTDYDIFRFAIAVAYNIMRRFDGLCGDMLGEGFSGLSRRNRLRAIADTIYVVSATDEEKLRFSTEHRILEALFALMMSSRFNKGEAQREHADMLNAILRGFTIEAQRRR